MVFSSNEPKHGKSYTVSRRFMPPSRDIGEKRFARPAMLRIERGLTTESTEKNKDWPQRAQRTQRKPKSLFCFSLLVVLVVPVVAKKFFAFLRVLRG
jgi:hypothetical protein